MSLTQNFYACFHANFTKTFTNTMRNFPKLVACMLPFIFLLCQQGHANSGYTSDELAISKTYAYRLLTRQISTHPSKMFSDNIKPLALREIALLYGQNPSTNAFRFFNPSYMRNDRSFSQRLTFQPITEFRFIDLNASRKNTTIPGNSGETLNGHNTNILSASGNLYLKDYLLMSHETRVIYDQETTSNELYKFRFKKGFSNVSVSYAKESIVLGPGYFGNLMLSDNVEPEQIAMIKTEIPYKMPVLGHFRWYLWHIWYNDEQRPNINPKLLGLRLSFKPTDYFELAVTRTSYFSGESGSKVNSFSDLWKLFTAEDENAPQKTLNTDQLAGFDASLYLKDIKKYSPFVGGKIYTERVWNDVIAYWQDEDSDESALFSPLGTSFLYGLFLTTGKFDITYEYVRTTRLIYAHHDFGRDGSSNDGYIIGHFIGRDARAHLLELYYELHKKFHISTTTGTIENGISLAKPQETNLFGGGFSYFPSSQLQIDLNVNYLKRNLIDIDSSPVNYLFIDERDEEIYAVLSANYLL